MLKRRMVVLRDNRMPASFPSDMEGLDLQNRKLILLYTAMKRIHTIHRNPMHLLQSYIYSGDRISHLKWMNLCWTLTCGRHLEKALDSYAGRCEGLDYLLWEPAAEEECVGVRERSMHSTFHPLETQQNKQTPNPSISAHRHAIRLYISIVNADAPFFWWYSINVRQKMKIKLERVRQIVNQCLPNRQLRSHASSNLCVTSKLIKQQKTTLPHRQQNQCYTTAARWKGPQCKLPWQPPGGSMGKEGSAPPHYIALTLACSPIHTCIYTNTHI